ncbi:YihY/virulence factor BrkB family protein [Serinibacter arcticus]|uniref:Inner membrane protein YihY, formerly thought to be RNase BN n=1 Tax=Serinibacter arcticus TaxID=1655435 RepID=A0A4Z1E126_9MICO|nr:YihY/virulence factor BrkB family protein [Serinibacter arcticus]TGO05050.1 Inner membrane protein YihY, formerly thought to be RNase BN [Serinibacter arcticus]
MLATSVVVGLVVAVLARRVRWVHDRMPPPASTMLVAVGVAVVTLVLAEQPPSLGRTLGAVAAAAAAGAFAVLVGGVIVDVVLRPLRRWQERRPEGPTIRERVEHRADTFGPRVRGLNPVALSTRSVLRAGDVRVTGLAAEMSYYALISLVPIATALGSSLGFLRPLLGDAQVTEIRTAIVDALTSIFAEQVASNVLAPLVDGLLSEERTGFAVGALAVTLFLASRVFRAAVRALDDAYRVEARRNVVAQLALGLLFTLGALVTLVTVTLLVVVGPLLGDGATIAENLGLGDAFRVSWDALRWPVAFAIGLAFLTLLYRYAPNVRQTWRQCVPGAVVGSLGLLLVSSGFMLYVRLAAPDVVASDAGAAAVVQAAGQMLSLVLAGVLWLWLGSIVVLLGGILNAELDAERAEPAASETGQRVADPETRST